MLRLASYSDRQLLPCLQCWIVYWRRIQQGRKLIVDWDGDMKINRPRVLWSRNMILDVDLFAKSEVELLPYLSKLGYDIFFMSGYNKRKYKSDDSSIHSILIPVGENNFPLKYHLIFAVVQLFLFPFYLVKKKPNYVIVDWDSIFALLPMIPFCRLMGIKTILDIRSTPTPILDSTQGTSLRSNLSGIAFDLSVMIAKRHLDGFTIITELMKNEICSKFGIDPARVGVWTSGVSAELFFNEEYVSSGLALREKLGLGKKFVVFYHGGFSESRGLIEAINSMAVLGTRSDVVLFLLGKGQTEMVNDMRKAIQDKRIQDSVFLHDSVDHDDVPKYIAMCDVGLVPLLDLPQWRNQCPLKLLEYLAMKKPVILSDIPCHREVIGINKCGIFLPSVSAHGIAESVAFAFDHRKELERWGPEGRVIVEKNYVWPRVAERLDDYLRLVKDGFNSVNSEPAGNYSKENGFSS